MSPDEANELETRALQWCKDHDGGRLHARFTPDPRLYGPQLVVSWDHGGYGELGSLYAYTNADDDLELITDIFNWALEQLAPSTQNYYGTRTYQDHTT